MLRTKSHEFEEGRTTRAMEQVTARAPSGLFFALAGGSIATSLALFVTGRREPAIFVGLWPLAFLMVGNYNKLVKHMRGMQA